MEESSLATLESWNFFEDILPPEVTLIVFSHFSLEDVLYVSLVCKTWNTYFDTKHIWKQIYELHFGELSEKTVDLTAKLKWKRLFFTMANAQKWKFAFQKMATMFKFSAPQIMREYKELSEIKGRHHVVTCGSLIATIDLKTAAKVLARHSSPVKYHYTGHNLPSVWKSDLATIDSKRKDDNDKVPYPLHKYTYAHNYNAVGNGGEFIAKNQSNYCSIWNPTLHLTTDKHHPIRYIQQSGASYFGFSFNAKYVLGFGGAMFGLKRIALYDLSKQCQHCGWHTYNAKTKQYDVESTPCEDHCAFTDLGTEYLIGYAVQHNTDKFLLCRSTKIEIWEHGAASQEINFSKEISAIRWFSEHLTTVAGRTRHWLVYATTDATTFVDLNDLTCKFAIPKIDSITWVPNKNTAILVSGAKATVFDVERRKWQAKISGYSAVNAVCFNSSAHLLFIADSTHIHAYQWETARLVASVPHECGVDLKRMHFAFDQVFCLVRARHEGNSDYIYKRVIRCDV